MAVRGEFQDARGQFALDGLLRLQGFQQLFFMRPHFLLQRHCQFDRAGRLVRRR